MTKLQSKWDKIDGTHRQHLTAYKVQLSSTTIDIMNLANAAGLNAGEIIINLHKHATPAAK